MRIHSTAATHRTRVTVVTADPAFERSAQATFAAAKQVDLSIFNGHLSELADKLQVTGTAVVVVDLDAGRVDEMAALARLMARIGDWPPVVAIMQGFDQGVARTLLQMRIADFLVKPVEPVELVRACARVAKGPSSGNAAIEAEIITFLPAVGGAGVTTLAVQTAMLLTHNAGLRTRASTCLVDLDFQHGSVADYLDLEPRLDLAEIEPRPDRLDRQLLEVMLSYHSSGLAVVAAPNRPAEMRSFDPDVVTRLLDLVSTNFEYVVFDMPRTWFSWTDSVLLGSNRLFIVSETSVPALRHAKQLITAITERLGDKPNPRIVVNRFQKRFFGSGLSRRDLHQTLGDAFIDVIPNDYALVREAIDRGVPLEEVKRGNKITAQLKKLTLEQPANKPTNESTAPAVPTTKPTPKPQKLKLVSAN